MPNVAEHSDWLKAADLDPYSIGGRFLGGTELMINPQYHGHVDGRTPRNARYNCVHSLQPLNTIISTISKLFTPDLRVV